MSSLPLAPRGAVDVLMTSPSIILSPIRVPTAGLGPPCGSTGCRLTSGECCTHASPIVACTVHIYAYLRAYRTAAWLAWTSVSAAEDLACIWHECMCSALVTGLPPPPGSAASRPADSAGVQTHALGCGLSTPTLSALWNNADTPCSAFMAALLQVCQQRMH